MTDKQAGKLIHCSSRIALITACALGELKACAVPFRSEAARLIDDMARELRAYSSTLASLGDELAEEDDSG